MSHAFKFGLPFALLAAITCAGCNNAADEGAATDPSVAVPEVDAGQPVAPAEPEPAPVEPAPVEPAAAAPAEGESDSAGDDGDSAAGGAAPAANQNPIIAMIENMKPEQIDGAINGAVEKLREIMAGVTDTKTAKEAQIKLNPVLSQLGMLQNYAEYLPQELRPVVVEKIQAAAPQLQEIRDSIGDDQDIQKYVGRRIEKLQDLLNELADTLSQPVEGSDEGAEGDAGETESADDAAAEPTEG